MQVIQTIAQVRRHVAEARSGGRRIGLVPTMGALHAGHAALIRRAVDACGFVVVSIFVNPTQFGPGEDFEDYPRTLDEDCETVEECSGDLIFAPSAGEMYPGGYETSVSVENLDKVLCGRHRPGHFRGVCTVVAKLLNIVRPDVAYFGQKDAQQVVILQRMVEDLNFPVELEVLPTVREDDGLAMSSRNKLLSPVERQDALCLFWALQTGFDAITRGERDPQAIREKMQAVIAKVVAAETEYIEIVDTHTLKPLEELTGHQVLVALAVHIGNVRLIDNMVVDLSEG